MKILHLATSLKGGAGRAALRIRNAQNLYGIEATIRSRDAILTSDIAGMKISNINPMKQLESSTLTLIQSKLFQKSADLVTPFSISTLNMSKKELDNYELINLHATYNFLNSKNIIELGKLRKPLVFTLHDQRILTGGCHYSRGCNHYKLDCKNCPQVKNPWQSFVSRSFKNQKETFKYLNNLSFVTPSNWLAMISMESEIGRNVPVSVINNPIPNKYFDAMPNRKKDQTLRIGFMAANLQNPFKGLDVLVSAIEKLPFHTERPFTLKLIGKGTQPRNVGTNGISQVVADSDDEVISEIIDLDVLVVPSTEDNSPSVIGEALALGVRVIGSNVGGITEILQKFGMPIFKSRDSDALAAYLGNLPIEFNSDKLRKLAKEEFGEHKIANLYSYLYNCLIQ